MSAQQTKDKDSFDEAVYSVRAPSGNPKNIFTWSILAIVIGILLIIGIIAFLLSVLFKTPSDELSNEPEQNAPGEVETTLVEQDEELVVTEEVKLPAGVTSIEDIRDQQESYLNTTVTVMGVATPTNNDWLFSLEDASGAEISVVVVDQTNMNGIVVDQLNQRQQLQVIGEVKILSQEKVDNEFGLYGEEWEGALTNDQLVILAQEVRFVQE